MIKIALLFNIKIFKKKYYTSINATFFLLLFIRYSIYSIITTECYDPFRYLILYSEVLKTNHIHIRINVTCCLISFTFYIEANGNVYEKSVSLKINIQSKCEYIFLFI